MKRYVEQMDRAEVSDELHERLMGLSCPKRTVPWKKYAAAAAALVLAVGAVDVGWRAMGRDGSINGTMEIGQIEPAIETDTIGFGHGGDSWDTDGGYEVVSGEMTSYYLLPAIVYNKESMGVTADYSLAPTGAVSREAERADVQAMLGKTDMAAHLLWGDDLVWGGTIWYDENGTACAAALYAEGAGVSFDVEILAGGAVPDCIAYPDEAYERTNFLGAEITGVKNIGYQVREDGTELRESRRVSCVADGIGYKMTIYGIDGETVEAMCARFIRYAVAEGFDLAALSEGHSDVDGTEPGGQMAGNDNEIGEQDSAEQCQEACTLPYNPEWKEPVPNSRADDE